MINRTPIHLLLSRSQRGVSTWKVMPNNVSNDIVTLLAKACHQLSGRETPSTSWHNDSPSESKLFTTSIQAVLFQDASFAGELRDSKSTSCGVLCVLTTHTRTHSSRSVEGVLTSRQPKQGSAHMDAACEDFFVVRTLVPCGVCPLQACQ